MGFSLVFKEASLSLSLEKWLHSCGLSLVIGQGLQCPKLYACLAKYLQIMICKVHGMIWCIKSSTCWETLRGKKRKLWGSSGLAFKSRSIVVLNLDQNSLGKSYRRWVRHGLSSEYQSSCSSLLVASKNYIILMILDIICRRWLRWSRIISSLVIQMASSHCYFITRGLKQSAEMVEPSQGHQQNLLQWLWNNNHDQAIVWEETEQLKYTILEAQDILFGTYIQLKFKFVSNELPRWKLMHASNESVLYLGFFFSLFILRSGILRSHI